MKESFNSIKRHLKFSIYEFLDQERRKSLRKFGNNDLNFLLKSFLDHISKEENVKVDLSKYIIKGNLGLIIKYLKKVSFIKCVEFNFYNKLYGMKIAEEIGKLLPNFKHISCLRINLGKNFISDDGAKILSKALSNLSNLNTLGLELSHNHIGNKGLQFLSKAFSNLIILEKIELNLTNYQSFDEDEINCLVNNLTQISISDSGFMNLIESIKLLTSLRFLKLNFTDNSLTNKSMRYLSKFLTKLNNLNSFHLYLAKNLITNTGMKYLLESIKLLSKLTELQLYLGDIEIDESYVEDMFEYITNKQMSFIFILNENKILKKKQIFKDKYQENVKF